MCLLVWLFVSLHVCDYVFVFACLFLGLCGCWFAWVFESLLVCSFLCASYYLFVCARALVHAVALLVGL